MPAPKPVTVTSALTDGDATTIPQALLLVIPGYNAGVAQTLQHNASGVITWVNNP